MRVARRAGVASALLVLCGAPATAQTANGPEFQVNTYTTSGQATPDVAVDRNGHFVVVWAGAGEDDASGVFGRRYRSSGEPFGDEFRVNTSTTQTSRRPEVGADAEGGFVVAWKNADGYVWARRFGADGTASSPEFLVDFAAYEGRASLDVQADGSFVVASLHNVAGTYGSYGYQIWALRYDSAGAPVDIIAVDAVSFAARSGVTVQGRSDQSFIVAWSGSGPGDDAGIFARRFNDAGTAMGAVFRVNFATAGSQTQPALAIDGEGGFLVGWRTAPASVGNIEARRFDADGEAIGLEFTVNAYLTGDQHSPSVAVNADGRFVLAWSSPSAGGVQARLVEGAAAVGSEFAVGTQPGIAPAVTARGPGDFVVVWEDTSGQDGDGNGVFGQRYGDLIFADGFSWGTGGP
jgi:hypothetical protein